MDGASPRAQCSTREGGRDYAKDFYTEDWTVSLMMTEPNKTDFLQSKGSQKHEGGSDAILVLMYGLFISI